MRLLRGALVCVVALGFMACSDDTTGPADSGPDMKKTDTVSPGDLGVDTKPDQGPPPDGQPDQPIVTPDTGVDMAGDMAGDTMPDMTPDITPDISPDLGPDVGPDMGPPMLGTCANAQTLTLIGGKATVSGDTTGVADEFPTLKCSYGYVTSTITMDGGQHYYKFAGTKDQWYKVVLGSTFADAHAVIFTNPNCTEAGIQTDCQSGGATGEFSEDSDAGDNRAVYFKAPITGDIYVAVDSEGAEGAYTLTITELTAPTNGTCAGATALTLTGGAASIEGDLGPKITPNEYGTDIKCGASSAWDEAQAYYKFTATAGTRYKISVTSDSAGWLYLLAFQAASCGTAASINADCGSNGTDGDYTSFADTGKTVSMVLTSTAGGDYVIAVDTRFSEDYGGFTLKVEEFPVPTNSTCAGAQTLTLQNGTATASGDTLASADEFSGVNCRRAGGTSAVSTTFDGPQLYYKWAATQDQWYKVSVQADFTAYFYLFSSSTCTEAAIDADCQTDGTAGTSVGSIFSGQTESVYFKAPATGDLYVAVDSTSATTAGTFKVTVTEVTAPTNGTCATATPLTFVGGKALVSGWTGPFTTPDEFGGAKCGGTTETTTLDGPQAYYSFTVDPNSVYSIKMTPTDNTSSLYVYAFPQSCTQATIESSCEGASSTLTGTSSLIVAPTAAGTYVVAVDSSDGQNFGGFDLEIEEIVKPSNSACATPTAITLTAGKATINGSTFGASDEFGTTVDCGGSALDGPNVYYELTPAAGKTYKVKFTPTFSAYAYWFQKASCGTAATVETDCSSAGVNGNRSPFASANSTVEFYVGPSTGAVLLAVDSTDPNNAGTFTLEIEEVNAPTNGTCATATPITLTAGLATVNGTTGGTADEFGADVDCGGFSDFDGPNAYYELTPTAGKFYKVTLDPNFSAYLYWFNKASCPTAATIDTDCASSGVDGDYAGSISKGGSGSFTITGATAPVIIGIDSTAGYNSGDFVLKVEEITPPANDTCAGAQALTFTAGKATASGQTGTASATLDPSCESLPGPDLFYSVPVTSGKTYLIQLSPSATFDPALYILDACAGTCVASADDSFSAGGAEQIVYTATATGTIVVAVDSYSATAADGQGAFTLDVSELGAPPTGLVLQEINVGADDYVVIKNTGTAAVDLTGVQIVLTDSTVPNADNAVFLPPQQLAAGASLYLVEDSTPQAGDFYMGSIFYTSSSSFLAMLCYGNCDETKSSNVLDAGLFGSIARTLPTGVTFTGGPVGGITSANENTTSYTRVGSVGVAPAFLASDWGTAAASR
jgi:hypothetical protein